MTDRTRSASLDRETKESTVHVTVDLDGTGAAEVSTGVGFYDHMLASFARHSLVDLVVRTEGDTHIDAHHSVEDTAIVLGETMDHLPIGREAHRVEIGVLVQHHYGLILAIRAMQEFALVFLVGTDRHADATGRIGAEGIGIGQSLVQSRCRREIEAIHGALVSDIQFMHG